MYLSRGDCVKIQTINEFANESNIEMILELMSVNGGYITSKQVTELGIHRMYLKIMIEKNMIEKVDKGVYITKETLEDVYYTFQLRYPKIIFSRFTALYFYGLTEIYPSKFDVTVNSNYHVENVNKNYSVIKCDKSILELGLTEVKTPLGHVVKVYDRERCICDIIKYKNRLDIEQVKKSVKMYLKDEKKNLNNLSLYSKKMGINAKVMEFVGMFYE